MTDKTSPLPKPTSPASSSLEKAAPGGDNRQPDLSGKKREYRERSPSRPGREISHKPKSSAPETSARPSGRDRHDQRSRPRPDRTGPPSSGRADPDKPHGATKALIDLDHVLMKLLARRAVLVSRIRGGKSHASSPAAIQAEKAVRVAWETGALSFSKDPRFSRQLFTLLQELEVLTREQAEAMDSFRLSPARKPVSGVITGPTAARSAQMHTALAAGLGKELFLPSVMLSAGVTDTVNACAQAGASVTRATGAANIGSVHAKAGQPLLFAGKSLYAGEDSLTLHLLIFLALGQPGVFRLGGGANLKHADLSCLRHALPLFGARLAHVIPHSHGLPANVECSGDIPPHVLVPADLPFEATSALLLALLVWNRPVTLDLSALPAAQATAALAEVGPLHKACGADVESHGPRFVYTPAGLSLPEQPELPLDPALAAYLLALPVFAGGSLRLKGHWPENAPQALEATQLLSWAGARLKIAEDGITASADKNAFATPLQIHALSSELAPLFLALAVLAAQRTGQSPPLAPLPCEDADEQLIRDFLVRLGFACRDDRLDGTDAVETAWTSPDAWWSMAFALAAFAKPGLRLANPGSVSGVMPPFWSIYNSLPNPADPAEPFPEKAKEEKAHDKPVRRRIRTE